jgi:Tol biopolymer transport system component
MRKLLLIILLAALAVIQPATAQFLAGNLPFGKNKKQYEKFQWRYIQSANFDVYFHGDAEYVARYAALKAEDALRQIQDELSFSITKRIVLIIYSSHNQFQQTNVIDQFMTEGIGGVTELFKNRVVIPFEGDYAKFRHVVHHELVHAVINDMFYGGSVQSLINNSGTAMLPLWMNEGYAEYSSAQGLDVKTDMFMRDVAVSEYLRGLNQLNGYFAYRGGQAFWSYIATKYGKGKVGELLNRFRSIGDVDRTFRATFGMTYEEMSEQWAKDEKKFYFPDVSRYEYVEDFATRLTNHQKQDNFYNTSPAISPDGESVAFLSDRGDNTFGLWVMDLQKKEPRRLAASARSTDFEELNFLTPGISWNPSGKKLAVGAKGAGQDAIYIVDVATGDYQSIVDGFQTIGAVAWSPDGKYLAFDADSGGKHTDIYIYEFASKRVRRLTYDVFTDMLPTWSPDGTYVYFVSDRTKYTTGNETTLNFDLSMYDVDARDVYRVNVAKGTIERITRDPDVGKYSLELTPDGKQLLYSADYNGISNVWKLDLQSGKRVALTNSLQEVSQISLSNDGTKLLFASQNRVGYDLFLIKFPLDLKERDTLPMTLFRQQQVEEKNALASVMDRLSSTGDSTTVTYDAFDVQLGSDRSVAPSDVATPVGTPDGDTPALEADFTPKDYKVSFSPDVVTGNAGYSNWFGANGQIQLLFSDMMGDHEIYVSANLFLDLNNSSFLVSYAYRPEIIDYNIAVFQNAGFTYVRPEGSPVSNLYRLRNYGGLLWASYPFSRYSRIDLGSQIMMMSRENIDVPQDPSLSRFVTVPTLSYVYDDALLGFWAPTKGTRANITLEASPKWGSSGLSFATARFDGRHYIHLGGPYTIAVRGSGGVSVGGNPQKFFVGGVDNWFNRFFSDNGWPFVNPEDFAFTRPGWPLRGWALNERNGTQYLVTNVELRFPFLFLLQAGPLPSLFQGLQGQVFFDAGGAWNADGIALMANGMPAPNPMLTSFGFGIRSLALGLPLRFDVAWRQEPWGGTSAPVYLFSLGADF